MCPWLWPFTAINLCRQPVLPCHLTRLREPLRLEYKENPEYGLRLILTYRPTMSFLCPLDKCVALAKASILSPATLGDGA